MQAVVYHGPGDRRLENVPDPRIEDPNDVIVRVSTSTICGTDLHILRGDVHPRLLPPPPFNRMAATVSPRTSQKRLRNPLGEFVPANMSSREKSYDSVYRTTAIRPRDSVEQKLPVRSPGNWSLAHGRERPLLRLAVARRSHRSISADCRIAARLDPIVTTSRRGARSSGPAD
jgi:hypothetical protein